MKYLKYFENNIDGLYFIELLNINIAGNRYFYFLYNIRKEKNKYLAEYVTFSYKSKFNEIKIDFPFENSFFELPNLKDLITVDEFFNKNKEICILLYEHLLNLKIEYEKLNKKLIKLFNTLENIDEMKLYIDLKKYNI